MPAKISSSPAVFQGRPGGWPGNGTFTDPTKVYIVSPLTVTWPDAGPIVYSFVSGFPIPQQGVGQSPTFWITLSDPLKDGSGSVNVDINSERWASDGENYACLGVIQGYQAPGGFPAIMGASGPSHAPGLVPDPGPTAGVTKFLREDASFQVPPGGGGGSGPVLQTNGVDNGDQTLLNLTQGQNITISDDGTGGVSIDASGVQTLETNGVANPVQSGLNLVQGTNVTLTADNLGGVTIDVTAVQESAPGALTNHAIVVGTADEKVRSISPGSTGTVLKGNSGGDPQWDQVTEDNLSFSPDNTTADVSSGAHGLMPKFPNDPAVFFDGTGNYSAPPAPTPIAPAFVDTTPGVHLLEILVSPDSGGPRIQSANGNDIDFGDPSVDTFVNANSVVKVKINGSTLFSVRADRLIFNGSFYEANSPDTAGTVTLVAGTARYNFGGAMGGGLKAIVTISPTAAPAVPGTTYFVAADATGFDVTSSNGSDTMVLNYIVLLGLA